MSARPISLPQPTKEELAQAKRRSLRDDALYWTGAICITAGLGEIRLYLAPLSIGFFFLLTPLLGLAQSFLRGIRPGPRR